MKSCVWSKPYGGISHLKTPIKRGYQVSITHCPDDGIFGGGYDWQVISLDGFITVADGTASTIEDAKKEAEAEARRMKLFL